MACLTDPRCGLISANNETFACRMSYVLFPSQQSIGWEMDQKFCNNMGREVVGELEGSVSWAITAIEFGTGVGFDGIGC